MKANFLFPRSIKQPREIISQELVENTNENEQTFNGIVQLFLMIHDFGTNYYYSIDLESQLLIMYKHITSFFFLIV